MESRLLHFGPGPLERDRANCKETFVRGAELGRSKFIDFRMLINIKINSTLYFLKHFSIFSPVFLLSPPLIYK